MKNLTKIELLAQIENIKNNYVLGLAAISVFSEPFAIKHLQNSNCAFGGYIIDFIHVSALLDKETDRNIALKEFMNMLIRGLIKESFEVVRTYAKSTQQSEKFRGQQWFQFFRLIRNSVSHNFCFQFGDFDKKILPVSWRGRTIEKHMEGQPLEVKFLGYEGVWELFFELAQFVDIQLT